MCKIISIANQKGGVSKTTTARNLGYCLGKNNKKVLLIDFDPQHSLTKTFNLSHTNKKLNIVDLMNLLLEDKDLPPKEDYVVNVENIDLITAYDTLALFDIKLSGILDGDHFLEMICKKLRNDYDYILIDVCPSLGKLMINSLVACDEVIIPVIPDLYSADSLNLIIGTISKIKRRLNPNINIAGILFSVCDLRTKEHRNTIEEIKEAFKPINIFDTYIPKVIAVAESLRYYKSVVEYKPDSKIANCYFELANMI